jgi:hydrogenase expression/formation protein HypC
MCLGLPGRIVEVRSSREALVDFWGVQKCIRLDNLTQPPQPGDYIIDHAGFAVRVIPPEDVADTLGLYEILLAEAGEDPIIRDVVDELEHVIDLEGELVQV